MAYKKNRDTGKFNALNMASFRVVQTINKLKMEFNEKTFSTDLFGA
jgi:hypothetical protein